MVKNKYLAYVLFVVLMIVFWNLIDFLYSSVITHNGYQFGIVGDLAIPLVVAVAVGYLLFLRKK